MRFAASVMVAALAAGASPCAAQQPAVPLRISGGWARPQADASRPSGGYVTIVNPGADTVVVTAVRCAAAGSAEIHETTLADGMMRMRRLPELAVAPGATVVMRPGAVHLMLMDLRSPLSAGQTVGCSFGLRGGATVEFALAVRAP